MYSHGSALCGQQSSQEPVHGHLFCHLGDGALLRVEPPFGKAQEGVHLIAGLGPQLVAPPMEVRCRLVRSSAIPCQYLFLYLSVVRHVLRREGIVCDAGFSREQRVENARPDFHVPAFSVGDPFEGLEVGLDVIFEGQAGEKVLCFSARVPERRGRSQGQRLLGSHSQALGELLCYGLCWSLVSMRHCSVGCISLSTQVIIN